MTEEKKINEDKLEHQIIKKENASKSTFTTNNINPIVWLGYSLIFNSRSKKYLIVWQPLD